MMKPRRKPRPHVEIPTASMGDVAFNLISFFLVCSTAAVAAGAKVELPKSKDIKNLGKPPSIVLSLDSSGKIMLQGTEIGLSDLELRLSSLIDAAKSPKGKQVLIKCDQVLDRKKFEPVIEVLAKCGAILVLRGETPRKSGAH